MNDAMKILGVLILTAFLAFSLTGKSPREVASDIREQNIIESSKKTPTLLSMKNYIPPTWLGKNTALQTDADIVIDGEDTTNSGTVLVSNTVSQKERSNFKNSATNNRDNGTIVIAAEKPNRTFATASINQANLSQSGETISYGSLLLIIVMLMILVFLARLTRKKKKQLQYHNQYSYIPRINNQTEYYPSSQRYYQYH